MLESREDASGDPAPAEANRTFSQYHPELYRYLIRRLGGVADAEDLAQEVYVRFLQVPHPELVRQPRAYLRQIAANLLKEFGLRKQRGRVTFDSDTAQEQSERASEGEVWTSELGDRLNLAQQLERIVRRLPATYQAVLILRTREGLSRNEIAKRLGITSQTVKKYLFRSIAHCRAASWDR